MSDSRPDSPNDPLVTPPPARPEVVVTPPPVRAQSPDAPTVAASALARFEHGEGHGVGALLAVSADGHRLVSSPIPDTRTADGYLRMTARILVEEIGRASCRERV